MMVALITVALVFFGWYAIRRFERRATDDMTLDDMVELILTTPLPKEQHQ